MIMKRFGQKYRMIAGVLLVLLGLSLQLQGFSSIISIPVMVAGMLFLVTAVRIYREGDSPRGDERTRKLGAFASAYSWFSVLMLACLLFWVDYLDLAELSVQHVLGLVIFFMIATLVLFRWYFVRKGDAR